MTWRQHGPLIVLTGALLTIASAAQTGNASPTSKDKTTIRVGIAVTLNRSGRQASPVWVRDQLVRELQRKRNDRKSDIVLEAVPLEGQSQEDAAPEASRKQCQFFVLTTVVDARRGPGVSGGPDGITPAPIAIGNARTDQILAIDFTIVDASDSHTVDTGTGTATVEDHNDIRAADEAMRLVAHQVASRLRENRPPAIQ